MALSFRYSMDRYSDSLMPSVRLQGCAVTTAKACLLPTQRWASSARAKTRTSHWPPPQPHWPRPDQPLPVPLFCNQEESKRSQREEAYPRSPSDGGVCLIPRREEASSASPSPPCLLSSVLAVTSPGAYRKGRGPQPQRDAQPEASQGYTPRTWGT